MRAFSLIEVMVVAAIVGILASLSIGVGSDTVRSARSREDRESVRALLIQSRNHARRNGACVVVTRASATELTAAVSTTPTGCPAAPHAEAPSPASVTLIGGSTIGVFDVAGSPTSSLTFFPDGSTRALAPVVMPFARFDGAASSLQIWPGAGIVTEEGG